MKLIRTMLVRLAGMFWRERRDRELAAEMEAHLEMHIEENVRRAAHVDPMIALREE